jgi:hypothetical protein
MTTLNIANISKGTVSPKYPDFIAELPVILVTDVGTDYTITVTNNNDEVVSCAVRYYLKTIDTNTILGDTTYNVLIMPGTSDIQVKTLINSSYKEEAKFYAEVTFSHENTIATKSASFIPSTPGYALATQPVKLIDSVAITATNLSLYKGVENLHGFAYGIASFNNFAESFQTYIQATLTDNPAYSLLFYGNGSPTQYTPADALLEGLSSTVVSFAANPDNIDIVNHRLECTLHIYFEAATDSSWVAGPGLQMHVLLNCGTLVGSLWIDAPLVLDEELGIYTGDYIVTDWVEFTEAEFTDYVSEEERFYAIDATFKVDWIIPGSGIIDATETELQTLSSDMPGPLTSKHFVNNAAGSRNARITVSAHEDVLDLQSSDVVKIIYDVAGNLEEEV